MKKRYAKVGRYRVVAWGSPRYGDYSIRRYDPDERHRWFQVAGGYVEESTGMNFLGAQHVVTSCPDDLSDFCEALKTAYRLAVEVMG